jgi:hypothetical protein
MEGELGPGKTILGFRCLFRSSNKWLIHPRLAPAIWIDRLEAHLAWIASRPELQIIHLVRRDNLGWLRSKALSGATGKYVGAAYPSDLQISIPVASAIRRVKAKMWLDGRLESLRSSNRYLQIAYEDFLADNQAHAVRAARFLGADPEAMPALQLRIRPQSSSHGPSQVRNLEELRENLRRLDLLGTSRLPDR